MDHHIRAHLETLEAAPGDAEAFRALELAYRTGRRFEELASLLEARSRVVPAAEAVKLLAQAAEVARRDAANPVRAEELYRALLASDPVSPLALEALSELAEARKDWAALAEVLERRALATSEPVEGARLALRLGRLHEEQLGRRDRAALRYAGAVRLDPGLVEARRRGLDACLALRRYGQAKRLLDGAREAEAEPKGLALDYARLGATLADHALFHDIAMDALIEAQTLDRAAPGVAETRERLAAVPRRWREEATDLEARASTAPHREAAEYLLRAAQLQAAYAPDGHGPAVALLERAWTQVPGQLAVLELLERILEERKDFGGHAAALERLVASTRDRGGLVQLHLAAARLKMVRLADGSGALASLLKALELDAACETAALQSFEQLTDAGRFADALVVLERHLEATPEKAGHALLRVRAAELARTRLDDGERALRHLEAALRADPGTPRRPRRWCRCSPIGASGPGWRRCWRCGWRRSPTPPSGSGCRSGWPPSSWSSWTDLAMPSGPSLARWRWTRAAARFAPRWRRRRGEPDCSRRCAARSARRRRPWPAIRRCAGRCCGGPPR
jgi:tetratricopeptide (TPR) repeat protein